MFQIKNLAMGLFLTQSVMVSVDGLQLMKARRGVVDAAEAGGRAPVKKAAFFDLDETVIFRNGLDNIFRQFPDQHLLDRSKIDDAFLASLDRGNLVEHLPEIICLENNNLIPLDTVLAQGERRPLRGDRAPRWGGRFVSDEELDLLRTMENYSFTSKWVILTLIQLRKAGVDLYIISRGGNADMSKKLFDKASEIAGFEVRPVAEIFSIQHRGKSVKSERVKHSTFVYNTKPEIVDLVSRELITHEGLLNEKKIGSDENEVGLAYADWPNDEQKAKVPETIWNRFNNVGPGNGCENMDARENGYYKHDVIKAIIAHNGYTDTIFADDDEDNRNHVTTTNAVGGVFTPSFTVWDLAYQMSLPGVPSGPAEYLERNPDATLMELMTNVYGRADEWMGNWGYQRCLGQTEFRAITNLFPAVPVRAAVAVPADRGAAAPADFVPNAAAVQRLVTNMGFSEGEVVLALRNCNNDVPTAVQWILDNPEEAPAALATPATVAPPATVTVTTSVEELMDNGFTREQVNQVLRQVENCTLTDARAWLARQQQEPVLPPHSPVGENPTPADIPAARTGGDAPTPAPRDAVDVPVSVPAVPVVDLQTVAAIVEMGYEETQVRDALQQCNNNREAAVEMLRGAAESAPVSSPAGVNPAPAPRQVSTPRQGVISAPAPRRRRVAHRPIARRTGSADPSDPATSTAAPGRRPSSHSAGGDVAAQVAGNVTSDPASGTSVAATCAHTRGRSAVTSEQRAAARRNSVPDFASDTPMCDECCSW